MTSEVFAAQHNTCVWSSNLKLAPMLDIMKVKLTKSNSMIFELATSETNKECILFV